MKPAGQTRGIAKLLHEILRDAGGPADVVHFLSGPGSKVGAALVESEHTAVIAFTGSMEVGRRIIETAARTSPRHVKKVIAEMGGKNAIIVDGSADLDEAVLGVRDSAFGYCGQKCSACSRVIVVEPVHDVFLERLCAATAALTIGDPVDPATDLGPVIDEGAQKSIMEYVAIGKREARLALEVQLPRADRLARGRHYVAPHVFAEVPPDARIANEEIFGPVLSVMKVASFAEALALANGTAFALTGGVYSRTPSHIAQAREEFRVGVLYVNRGITGALVGRQPFGGFRMSGTGTKAGGADYLMHFVEPRSICENTMRRGFAPEI
jgi:RHH-type proline utilization regulon transcriptional repressor/proline dehydrogenase/delta 1-pyrroline-5-carboxylate dehydrogenase